MRSSVTVMCSTMLFLAICGIAAKAEQFAPTEVDGYGDCVPPYIEAPRSAFQSGLDLKACLPETSKNYSRCTRKANETATTVFFMVDCNSENGYFISLNGDTYRLHLVSSTGRDSDFPSGLYEGEGLNVEITRGKLVKRIYDSPSSDHHRQILNEDYQVLVVVKKEGRFEKILGISHTGP